MSRLFTALILSSTVALAGEPRGAVVPYQGLGADPGAVERLTASLRTPAPLNTTQGSVLGATTWFGPTRGLGQDYGVVLEPGAWHSAEFHFNPDAGTFQVSLDEQPVPLPSAPFPPMGWSPHLGAFSFGEGVANDVYLTDLRISQP